MAEKKSSNEDVPKHIAIIMDGNGRWAQKRGLPRSAGHKVGAEVFKKIATYAKERGAKHFTVYAFSTENWKRSQDEVKAIMGILSTYLDTAIRDFKKYEIKVRILGDITPFSDSIKAKIAKAEALTEGYECICNIALNYGGRMEIVNAANRAFEKSGGPITEEQLEQELYTKGQPDPDLIIRTSGEQRLSNFFLWQCAYSEFYFTERLWPDFKEADLDEAIAEYGRRQRRYGGV